MGVAEHERFRGLVLRHRGRTGLTQRQLAAELGVHVRSVQDWEIGVNYPGAERLRALIGAFLHNGGLTSGAEKAEAEELWTAVLREAPRMRAPFDDFWFSRLLAESGTSPASTLGAEPRHGEPRTGAPAVRQPTRNGDEHREDWGEAPDVLGFVGRADELARLQGWVLEDRCRLVAVVGMGGIGKTTLAAKLAEDVAPAFQRVYWRSLRNALPAEEWLGGAISFLSAQQQVPPEGEAARLAALLELLREQPCLLVLDNLETLLVPRDPELRYRDGYAGYGTLVQAVADGRHRSCLLLTSRESPPEFALINGGQAARVLELGGLSLSEGQALLAAKQLSGTAEDWATLVGRFGGNGLALKMVGESVRQVFGGSISAFLEQSEAGTSFGGMRRVLDEQIERTAPLGQRLLTMLAIQREPVHLTDWVASLGPRVGRGVVLEAVEGLRRRSLVDRGEASGTFTLQSAVLEHLTDRLVDDVADEITQGQPLQLVQVPLIMAQAKDYVRKSQERLIGRAVLQQLIAASGRAEAERLLMALIQSWRGAKPSDQGYGPGNVVNLLALLRGDLKSVDLSRLHLRQVYLQELEMQDASLAGAELQEAILADAFGQPMSLSLSDDGRYLAACTSPGGLRLWRVADRTPILAAEHIGAICVALSGDGRLMASGGPGDATIKLWDVAQSSGGQLVATLAASGWGVWQVALSRDARVLANRAQSGVIEVWDVPSRSLIATLPATSTPSLRAMALSANGTRVASGGQDGTITLWDVPSGQSHAVVPGHPALVLDVALSADGSRVATCDIEGLVETWNTPTARRVGTFEGHAGTVWTVAISADGNLLASAGSDGTARLWDVPHEQLIATLQGSPAAVSTVSLSGDGRLLASGSPDGSIRLWDCLEGQLLSTLQGQASGPRCVAISADKRVMASGNRDGSLNVWDCATGSLLTTVRGHSDVVYGVALSSDGRLLASCSSDGSVKLWETSRGEAVASLGGLKGGLYSVALSRDGRLVAAGSGDWSLGLWDASSGQLLSVFEGLTGGVLAVAFSADGTLIAGGAGDGTVKVWEVSSRKLRATLTGPAAIRAVFLGADGCLLAAGSDDGNLRLWQGPTLRVPVTLSAHPSATAGVAVSDDGRVLVSGGSDGAIKQWDAADGQLIATVQAHSRTIYGLAVSADGQLLASASGDGTVKLWDAQNRVCLRIFRIERRYERVDITDLKGITAAQRQTLVALGAVERSPVTSE